MIESVSEDPRANGHSKRKIHFELFNTSAPSNRKKRSLTPAITTSSEQILDERKSSEHGRFTLDAALDAGADVPYACKGAVCCTCRAKVIEGSAEMVMNYALVDEEVKIEKGV